MIAEAKKTPTLSELHAGAKALYLDLCSHHVENADESSQLPEIRNLAEQVALKLGEVIRSRVNKTSLEGAAS